MKDTKPKVDFCDSFLVMLNCIMLIKDHSVLKDEHCAFFELTYMMVFTVVLPEHVLIPVDFILRQIRMLLTSLNLFAKFAANIAKVMIASVMHIEFVLIVKILGWAEEAIGVLLVDVLVQRLVLVIRLFKNEHRFVLQAQLTKIDFVCVNDMVSQGFFSWELSRCGILMTMLALIFAFHAVKVNFLAYFRLNLGVTVHDTILNVLDKVPIPFGNRL